jgi:hypothetical protein
VFPINGFAGSYQREIGPEHAPAFWDTLVSHGVLAYLCSHILAFDAQVQRGVLQVCTAGAGTLHRMPEGFEYLHCTQLALDADGLRCQVLDTSGHVREHLAWPPMPSEEAWHKLPAGATKARMVGRQTDHMLSFRFTGRTTQNGGAAQTLLAAFEPGILAALWIGLRGPNQVLSVTLGPEPGRSPHTWFGHAVAPGRAFDIRLLLDPRMGPGGLLHRMNDDTAWSSLAGASPWGIERLDLPSRWSIGEGQRGPADRPFRGTGLRAFTAPA